MATTRQDTQTPGRDQGPGRVRGDDRPGEDLPLAEQPHVHTSGRVPGSSGSSV